MRFVNYKIEHNIELISPGHPKNSNAYACKRARELNKTRLVYLTDKEHWPAFLKHDFAINRTDLLIFAGVEPKSMILAWDD